MKNSNTALIIIDVQEGMFNEAFPVHNGAQLLGTLGQLIAQARTAQTPIIYVQHRGGVEQHPLYPDGPGFPVHRAITPQAGDIVIQKTEPDAFYETMLQTQLQARGINHLVVAGIQTDYCVDTTVRRAHSLGYHVTLVQDGHSTWPDSGLTADQIITHHNTVLNNFFAQVKSAAQISFA